MPNSKRPGGVSGAGEYSNRPGIHTYDIDGKKSYAGDLGYRGPNAALFRRQKIGAERQKREQEEENSLLSQLKRRRVAPLERKIQQLMSHSQLGMYDPMMGLGPQQSFGYLPTQYDYQPQQFGGGGGGGLMEALLASGYMG